MFSISGKKIASVSLIAITVAIGTFGILKVSETKAATSLSGSCAMVVNLQHTFTIIRPNVPLTVDAMAFINFDSKQIWMNLTRATGDSNYSPTVSSNVNYASQAIGPINFSLDAGPIPGSYALSFASENISPPFILFPVNSGNTILMQGKNFKMTGVCQKI
jgi:hypothetical protein